MTDVSSSHTAERLDPSSYSVDELYEFFDFFDKTVEDLYSYILHRTRAPDKAEEMTLDVYFSLLKRQKFFWWKNATQLSTAFALADKAIETMAPWNEAAEGGRYLQELIGCVPKDRKERENVPERMNTIFHALRKLPLREQRMAVLHVFLHWPAAKTAQIVGRSRESIQKEYDAIMSLLCNELQKEPSLAHQDVCDVLNILFCPVLRESKKRSMRLNLLERCRTNPMSSMRFALPIGTLVLLFGVLGTSLVVPSLPASASVRTLAAAELLLMSQEVEYRNVFLEAEGTLRGIVAHYAEGDLADLSVQLAYPATTLHLAQDQEVRTILEKLKAKPIAKILLLLTPRASAHD